MDFKAAIQEALLGFQRDAAEGSETWQVAEALKERVSKETDPGKLGLMYRHLAEVLAAAAGDKIEQPVKVRHPDGRVVEYSKIDDIPVDDVPVFEAASPSHPVHRAPRLQRRRT